MPSRCPSPGMDPTPDADVRLAGQQTEGAVQSTFSHGVSQVPGLFARWLDFNADLGRRTALFWPPEGRGGQHACGTGPAWAILFRFPVVEQLCPARGEGEGPRAPFSHGRSSPGEQMTSADVARRQECSRPLRLGTFSSRPVCSSSACSLSAKHLPHFLLWMHILCV